jgi:Family of unknown function (DUF6481)
MSGFKNPGFVERRSEATNAKKAALEQFRAKTATDNPDVVQRQAARQASHAAREARAAERKAAKAAREVEAAEHATRDRELAERAKVDAAALAKREATEQAAREVTLQVGLKAARDARYAARKAKKR